MPGYNIFFIILIGALNWIFYFLLLEYLTEFFIDPPYTKFYKMAQVLVYY